MSNLSPIGPGVGGIAAGMAWGHMRNLQDDAASLAANANSLAKELAATRAELMRALAVSQGFKSTVNAIVDELKAEAAGTLTVRRVSDPENREARVQVFEDAGEDELNRLSGGRIAFGERKTPRRRKS